MTGRLARGLLIALGGVLLVGAFAASPGERAPIYGLEANGLAVAESVAFDRDLVFDAGDLARFEARHGVPPHGLHLERADTGWRLAESWLWGVLAAPAVALSVTRGPAVLNAVLLLAALVVVARRLRWRLGEDAVALVLVAFFFSWLPAFVFVAHSAMLTFATTVFALGLVGLGERPARSELPEIYGDEPQPVTRWGRDVAAGALAAVPVALHPVFLCVPLGVALAIPAGDRRRRGVLVAAGVVAVLAGLAVTRAQVGLDAVPWNREVVELDAETGFGLVGEGVGRDAGALASARLTSADLRRLVSDPRASAWSAVYALVGRSVGWLPYFLPCALLLGGWHRGERSGLALSALGGAILLVALLPFDFAGYAATAGNWAALPLYALLLFVPSKVPGRLALGLTGVLAAVVLWPLWLDPYSVRPNAGRTTRFVAPGVDRYLPVETTLRDVSRAAIGGSKVLRVEPVTTSLRVIGGRDLEWDRRRGAAGLLVSAPVGVEKIFLDFDRNAGSTLEIGRGEVVETLFRPSGRIAVVVRLADPRTHPTAATAEPTSFYTVRFEMPEAQSDLIRFRCSADTVGG